MKKIQLIALIFLVFATSSCQKYMADIFLPERPNKEFDMDPDATPEWRQGFEDGCEVGMAGGANTFYKMFYRTNKVDGYKMAAFDDYKNGYNAAYWWCYRKDFIKSKSSIWGSTFRGVI